MSILNGGGSPPPDNQKPDQSGDNPPQTPPNGGNWRDSLPAELKNEAGLQTFTDVTSLAKSYLHAQSLVGKKGIFVPGEKASETELNEFYKSLGRPELDKYEFEVPKELQLAPEELKKFKETAHKSGMLPKQAQSVLESYKEMHAEGVKRHLKDVETRTAEGIKSLQKEWGPGYDKQLALARLAVKEFGGEDFTKYLDSSGMGNDVNTIKFMARVGAMLGEDKLRGENSGKFGKTRNEIQEHINKVMGNPSSPYFDRGHPDHTRMVKEMEGYYMQLAEG